MDTIQETLTVSLAVGQQLDWKKALHLLNHGTVDPRPAHLGLMPVLDKRLFLERPPQWRSGGDRWRLSGLSRAVADYWMGDVGVRKRYGLVVCDGPESRKFVAYSRLRRTCKASGAAVEDRTVVLYVVAPAVVQVERDVTYPACAPTTNGQCC